MIQRELCLLFAIGKCGKCLTCALKSRCNALGPTRRGRTRRAIEIDPDLVAMLTDRFAENRVVAIVRGDATTLDFPDGRFSGAACFTMLHHVPTAELQDRLFSEVARVLRPAGVFVAGDSLASPELEAHHEGDTYNPVDPVDLAHRLEESGFIDVDVKTNPFGWAALARKS